MLRACSGTLLLLLAGVACGGDDRPRTLSAMPRYSGPIRVEGQAAGASRVIEGVLDFDREARAIEFVRADGARLSRTGDGPLQKEVSGAIAPASAEDLQDVTLLLSALYSAPAPGSTVTTSDGGYVIEAGGQKLTVQLGAATSD